MIHIISQWHSNVVHHGVMHSRDAIIRPHGMGSPGHHAIDSIIIYRPGGFTLFDLVPHNSIWKEQSKWYQYKLEMFRNFRSMPTFSQMLMIILSSFTGTFPRWIGNIHEQWFNTIHDGHDDVIKWKHFPRYWPFVWGIHRSPVKSPHKGRRRRALMFYLICAWINVWVNNREAGDLRRHRPHYDVIVMCLDEKDCHDVDGVG